jgi:hypothetical protein
MRAKNARKKSSSNSVPGESGSQFSPIVEAFRSNAQVSLGRMFGSVGLKVNDKVFAMMVKGALVVKLPRARVEALIGAHLGEPFDPGHGRLMKEWVAIKPTARAEWLRLAKEAQRKNGLS